MSTEHRSLFPFTAIAGQEQMKLALVLNAIYPLIGGVLITGTRGTAKSTAVRALAEVLPPPTPFVNMPVGATEDRVLGTLDMEKALKHGERHFEPGLLAQAHNGVLYIDEVNLLPDHLVDIILDTVAMGVNRVERDGISHEHAANIILVGTMNPEEGELRPQLLDRFGLCAAAEPILDTGLRKEAMRRRLAFDSDPVAFCADFAGPQQELLDRIQSARRILGNVRVSDGLLTIIVEKAAEAGADGLRADLSLHRAARAFAAWNGRIEATEDDLEAVSELALYHRRRRKDKRAPQPPPPKPQGGPPHNSGSNNGNNDSKSDTQNKKPADTVLGFGQPKSVPWKERFQNRATSGKTRSASGRGRGLKRSPQGVARISARVTRSIAIAETLRNAGIRRRGTLPITPLTIFECSWRTRIQKRRRLVVFLIDASGSMAALARMRAAKSAALALLEKAYRHRGSVALIAFRNESAEVLLAPTRSAFLAFRQLQELPAGGTTPLAAGLHTAHDVIRRALEKDPSLDPFLVLITDGKATFPANGFPDAMREASLIGDRNWPALCMDTEAGLVRFRQTLLLAELLKADYAHTEELPAANWAPIIEEWLSWE